MLLFHILFIYNDIYIFYRFTLLDANDPSGLMRPQTTNKQTNKTSDDAGVVSVCSR